MKCIPLVVDCHTHPAFESELFLMYAINGGIDLSLEGLLTEMRAARVEAAAIFASYVADFTVTNEKVLEIAKGYSNLIPIGSFNPIHPDLSSLRRYLSERRLHGLKMYPGYWSFYPCDKRFDGVFELCEKFKVPLFIHTGDTLIRSGRLKYSRPICVDELAVNRPELLLVLCHLGNPWIEEAAEVAYKNENVMLDLSGLYVEHGAPYRSTFLKKLSEKITYAITYVGDVEGKMLFGSDWPLASMQGVIRFVKGLHIKKEDKILILEKNARKLFGLKDGTSKL